MKSFKILFLLFCMLLQIQQLLAQDVEPESKPNDSLKVYSKFDFIPGEHTFFFDDFSTASIGDFPGRWNTNSSGEVITNSLFAELKLMAKVKATLWLQTIIAQTMS